MQVTAQRVSVRPLAGLRVVVVDDDRISLMAITAMVGSWSAEIVSSASGAYALRLIVEGTPDMDGFDLMKRVRELPPGQGGKTPGIAITSHPSFDSRRDAERAGYGAVFSKPFARDELIETIQRLSRP